MSSQVSVASVYQAVIEDVIKNIKEEFVQEGLDEQVLVDLQQLWQSKLAMARVIPHKDEPFKTELDEMQHYSSRILQGTGNAGPATGYMADLGPGFGAPATTWNQKATVAPSSIQFSMGSRTHQAPELPQDDGPSDCAASESQSAPQTKTVTQLVAQRTQRNTIAQLDGNDSGDEEDDEYEDVEDHTKQEDHKTHHRPTVREDGEEGEEDEDLGSGDDDEGDSEEDEEAAEEDVSVIICQYEKVHRTKNKWKTQLKDGVMHINGKDYVFSKAQGDFEW
eukprot:Colp12_sorted_trinity150504_noHs@7166